MKAEINKENKAKFFALYWDQDVLSDSMYGYEGTVYSATIKTGSLENKWLSLKPLSKISDEDAKVIDLQSAKNYDEDGWWDDHGDFYYWASFDADYFRSRGYALPWMGLSVEEMVEAGWIKLI